MGYNTTFQRSSDLGRRMNQVFVGIPFRILRRKLKYLCEMNGIRYVEQGRESYTSMASFWDLDEDARIWRKQDLCHRSFPAAGSAAACIRTAPEGGSTLMLTVL